MAGKSLEIRIDSGAEARRSARPEDVASAEDKPSQQGGLGQRCSGGGSSHKKHWHP